MKTVSADNPPAGEPVTADRDDRIFFQVLYALAAFSRNPRTAAAALLVAPDRQIIAYGVNDLPQGVRHEPRRFTDPEDKHCFVEHAERNAIFAAARAGRSTGGATLYTLMLPCISCARAIIQSGVTTVRWHALFPDPARNRPDRISDTLFAEAGVRVFRHDAPIAPLAGALADGNHNDNVFALGQRERP